MYLNTRRSFVFFNQQRLIQYISNNSLQQQSQIRRRNLLIRQQQIKLRNFIKLWMKLNSSSLLPNNLQEMPTHLSLSINNIEMKTIQKKINNKTSNILLLQPYLVIEQGKVQLTKLLILPSNQEIINCTIYNPSQLKFENNLEEFSISYKNNLNEKLPNFSNSTCEIFMQTLINDTLIDSTNIANIEYHSESNNFDLRFLSITIDPYKQNNQTNQIQIFCHLNDQSDTLLYYIEIKGFMCQLGEFYFYQVVKYVNQFLQYNTTKCSIFDQNEFESITSNQIQLKNGYWRPDYQSDLIEHCFKFVDFCEGGWVVSHDLCLVGHIGGQGNYFKNEENTSCQDCQDANNSVFPFVLTSICVLISTLLILRSTDKSNKLFSSLKIRQRFVKIIFKLNRVSYLNYFLIIYGYFQQFLLLIFNFHLHLLVRQVTHHTYGQQYGLLFIINLQYISSFQQNNHDDRINGVLIINNIYGVQVIFNNQTLEIYQQYNIYYTLVLICFKLCFINKAVLFSLLAKRIISEIEYISGDVQLLYNSPSHKKWIIGFVLPGLGLIGCLIPSALFLLLQSQSDIIFNKNLFYRIYFNKSFCYSKETNQIRQSLESIYVIYSMNIMMKITFENGQNYGKKQQLSLL
ncbi:unnamed protein product [Paramecium primaurelia]|uniref:Transmembrane protein n=1 Tax=Paramecium primaurelia TaxID=5886 RepID=A0A8S1PKQ8_PARPR|nr:unnamed protein product [Paramecium primaurelia]